MSTPRPIPAPQPEEAPEQAPQTKPERQPRRRFITPVFRAADGRIGHPGRTIIAAFALGFMALTATAQNTPNTPTPATPSTTTQQPVPPQGWTMFDDRVGRDLQLPADQLTRLREMDTRYSKDYSALGAEPWTNPGYRSLTDRRNAEIRTILTPQEYDRWNTRYNTPGTITPPRTNSPTR